ncbi:MAG: triose-phosphate isomerase [Candidatus Yanofskybacteria bacterium CG10_big_fil_rev_8_21_14_0_10_36_16]|uniref:Triosephosphate isomerase n=1 Tax=Candidatus Yanofskybacteria bacterium CG10_big_fil_rev_8_21_14_0_10_36_16 TaxID=1975096 RepID=A0A2J0QAS8_9BACT|nr:MAG: triose-phosphate isomerase [Candidatus Yanofskybacteria bacterium CG10_big_fil_rev_8_21_14_0_10_36_16]
MKKLIIANWKANPTNVKEAEDLFRSVSESYEKVKNSVDLVVCAPFVYLERLSQIKSSMRLGAQDSFWDSSGPFTGEITPDMLKNLGVEYVLIGHSERRYLIGEGNNVISKKVKAVLNSDMTPIMLVGEKDKNDERETVLEEQLATGLPDFTVSEVRKVILGYEPVWAISTNKNAKADTPENALAALGIIKNYLFSVYGLEPDNYKTIYGGSVNRDNIESFVKHSEIDGAAVGGASLRNKEFADMLEIVSNLG